MKSCGLNKIFLKQKLFPSAVSDWKVLLGALKEQVGGFCHLFIYLFIGCDSGPHLCSAALLTRKGMNVEILTLQMVQFQRLLLRKTVGYNCLFSPLL